MNTKCERLKTGSYEKLDQAIFKWLSTVWRRDVAVSALILKHHCPQQTLRFTKNGHFQFFVFQKVWYIGVTKSIKLKNVFVRFLFYGYWKFVT